MTPDPSHGDAQGKVGESAQPPTLSLPKGGGAIRGIGEKFAVNPANGTASFSVPVFTTPCRSSFYPQLSLSYDSGAGNGPFGLGWKLSLPSITRKTDKGLPQYRDAQESDIFILSDADGLDRLGSFKRCAANREQCRSAPRFRGLYPQHGL